MVLSLPIRGQDAVHMPVDRTIRADDPAPTRRGEGVAPTRRLRRGRARQGRAVTSHSERRTTDSPRVLAAWTRRRVGDLVVPFRHRDIRLLWGAKVASEIGDWSARLALAYLVLERTGSPLATAAVTAVALAPWLGLGQVLSTLADRFTHRAVMIVTDVVRVAVFLLIAWTPMPVWAVLALVFVASSASPPFEAARSAALPDLAGPEHYGHALMLFNATYQAGLLIGYAAGGGLVALVGPSWALTVNAATFALSGVLIAAIRTRTRATQDPDARPWSDLRGVAVHLRAAARVYGSDRLLRTAVLLLVLSCMPLMAAEGLVVLYAQDYAGGGAERAGLLSAVIAAGALVAMFVLPHTGPHERLLRVSALTVVGCLTVSGGLLLTRPDLAFGVLPLLLLGALASLTVSIGTILGTRLPHATRATAFSLAQGALMSSQGVGALTAGALAETTTIAVAVAAVSVPGLLWALWSLAVAGRDHGDPVVLEHPAAAAPERERG
jgi:MFS family permease